MMLAKSLIEKLTGRCAITAGLLLTVFFLFRGLTSGSAQPVANATVSPSINTPSQQAFRNIEDIRVGQRVVTNVPEGIHDIDGQPFDRSLPDGATRVDPATWRLIRMTATERWDDGTIDEILVETLQPIDWLETNCVAVGSRAPIPLDLVEMGASADLRAKVLAIEPCPQIDRGPGRVVLTTVRHLNRAIVELSVVEPNGAETKLQSTAFHRFYSLTSKQWVPASTLTSESTVLGADAPIRISSCREVPGVQQVFNLTVEGDHTFRVSHAQLLVHNNCPVDTASLYRATGFRETADVIRNGDYGLSPGGEGIARRFYESMEQAMRFAAEDTRRVYQAITRFDVPRDLLHRVPATDWYSAPGEGRIVYIAEEIMMEIYERGVIPVVVKWLQSSGPGVVLRNP